MIPIHSEGIKKNWSRPGWPHSDWGRGFRTHFPARTLEIECKSHQVLARGPVNGIPVTPAGQLKGTRIGKRKGQEGQLPVNSVPTNILQSGFVQCWRHQTKYSLGWGLNSGHSGAMRSAALPKAHRAAERWRRGGSERRESGKDQICGPFLEVGRGGKELAWQVGRGSPS